MYVGIERAHRFEQRSLVRVIQIFKFRQRQRDHLSQIRIVCVNHARARASPASAPATTSFPSGSDRSQRVSVS